MKKIILLRHAKAEFNHNLIDKKRNLDSIGSAEALLMSKKLHQKINNIDLVYCSDANRTIETANIVLFSDIHIKEKINTSKLYEAEADVYFDLLSEIDNNKDINSVMFVGHNPGISYFAELLVSEMLYFFSTCACVILTSTSKNWNEINKQNTKIDCIFSPIGDIMV